MKTINEMTTALGLAMKDIDANDDEVYLECFDDKNKKVYTNIKNKTINELFKECPTLKTIVKNVKVNNRTYTIKILINAKAHNVIDEHTTLYTKSFLNNNLFNIIPKNKPSTFVMCDIDLFKNINDKYGHIEGDRVLKEVSEILKNNIRETDFAIRFGGEEMLLIFPSTTSITIKNRIEKIREEIKNTKFESTRITSNINKKRGLMELLRTIFRKDNKNTLEIYNVTMSFGIYEYNPKVFQENPILTKLETIIERADRALYISKKRGRNRITEYSNNPSQKDNRKKNIN